MMPAHTQMMHGTSVLPVEASSALLRAEKQTRIVEFLTEARRVLKTGGIVVVVDITDTLKQIVSVAKSVGFETDGITVTDARDMSRSASLLRLLQQQESVGKVTLRKL